MFRFARDCMALFISLSFFSMQAYAARKLDLSTLSDGRFERQLELPVLETMPKDSPLYVEAQEFSKRFPFNPGERIRYIVTYLGVKAGVAEAVFHGPVKWGNGWAQRISGEVKNADWYSWLVKLHDSVEGVFDNSDSLSPLRFYINQQEPVNFRQTKLIHFDSINNKVTQIVKRKGRDEKSSNFFLESGAKDAFAAFYFFRSHYPYQSSVSKFEFPVFTSEKNWKLVASLLKQESVKVYGHSYDCDLYDMYTRFGGLMEQSGTIQAWVTRDERRLLVKAKAHIRFGSIEIEMAEWDQGNPYPGKPIWQNIRPK